MTIKNRAFICVLLFFCVLTSSFSSPDENDENAILASASAESDNYIKYIDFTPTDQALRDCMQVDINSYGGDSHISWIELLALYSSNHYGSFDEYTKTEITNAADAAKNGSIAHLVKNKKMYNYYLEAYSAILGGMIGEYTEITTDANGNTNEKKAYGLRVFSPIAAGYHYTDYDDFGASRSYGYKRSHLGHDMLGSVGTPIIACESGYIEHIGWNRYGGWRLGIRSLDGKRYYYYAHLRRGHPYVQTLYEGKYINAGELIGYLGMTGYSSQEDTNGIDTPHLHFGLQIIFDQKQIDGWNQIWCDMYELTRFLSQNRAKVYLPKDTDDKVSERYYVYSEMPD